MTKLWSSKNDKEKLANDSHRKKCDQRLADNSQQKTVTRVEKVIEKWFSKVVLWRLSKSDSQRLANTDCKENGRRKLTDNDWQKTFSKTSSQRFAYDD